MCVTAGGNVNAKDRKGGQTPVYLAAAAKQWDCVKYLLESGADSSIPCQVGEGESECLSGFFVATPTRTLPPTHPPSIPLPSI